MRDKETLLSFLRTAMTTRRVQRNVSSLSGATPPLRRAGITNVFQICTLVETKDKLTKRQKIGRGLRLCVDQDGERCYDRRRERADRHQQTRSYDSFANGFAV